MFLNGIFLPNLKFLIEIKVNCFEALIYLFKRFIKLELNNQIFAIKIGKK